MSEQDPFPEGEYVRRKAKLQVGDGPDARGEVTVEIVRGSDVDRHEAFTEWEQEVDRSVKVLRDQLGLAHD